jgi:hypothetical protein
VVDRGRSDHPSVARPPEGPTPAERRRAAPDPLGKRALFWVPVDPESGPVVGAHPDDGPSPRRGSGTPQGKRALFTAAPPRAGDAPGRPEHPLADQGPITVICSSCRAVRRVGLLDYLIFQLPVGYWLPRGRFDHKMTCPACRQRVWASVSLRRS